MSKHGQRKVSAISAGEEARRKGIKKKENPYKKVRRYGSLFKALWDLGWKAVDCGQKA